MISTNLAMVAMGLSAVGGWWLGRGRSNPATSATQSSSAESSFDALSQPPLGDGAQMQLQNTKLAYYMVAEMEKFKSGFLARSSHELRSPINSVISLHQLILSDLCENPAEEREFIAQAQDSAEKMLSLLDRLISLSKLMYGTEHLQIQPLQMADLLAEVQHFTELQAQNRSLRLEIELPDPDLYVLADPRWLRQVLMSLVDAPLGLMQEGYIRLQIKPQPAQQHVQIWIEDQRPAKFWSEPIDLLKALQVGRSLPCTRETLLQDIEDGSKRLPSAGLSLLIAQLLLEVMGGNLEVLAGPPQTATAQNLLNLPSLTRIQCSVPLASSEPQD